ncbi:MAG TPA: FGGY-family carbohydrate kinase [Paenirhodobacter sp.]
MPQGNTTPLVLSVDAGGTRVKVALIDTTGTIVAQGNAQVETIHYRNGQVERDPEAFWAATAHAIRGLMNDEVTARLTAIGCTGFGNGIFLVDAQGRPTRPGIVSVDHRAQPLVDRITAAGQAEMLGAMNGHRPWGGQTLTQLAWLAEIEPEVMAKTAWGLACKDFIRFRLTGEAFTDPSDASGGGLMHLKRQDYCTEAFDLLGRSDLIAKLPPIRPSSGVAGRVSAAAAAKTGLPEGLPVAGSMMDVAACALGAGVTSRDRMVMIAGTWAINTMEVRDTAPNVLPLLNMIYRDGASRLAAEGSPSSAANLGWYIERALEGRISVTEALEIAARCDITAERCYFLPYVNGPSPKEGAFLRLHATDTKSTMIRAICEGVAFQHRRHAEELLPHSAGQWPQAIRLTGGAARSPLWSQIFADACNLPVEVVDAEEVGALGAAICAAVAAGLFPDLRAAAAAMSRVSRVHEPNADHVAVLQGRYAEFLRLDEGMRQLLIAAH